MSAKRSRSLLKISLQGGFTLIELMVVVLIIGILGSTATGAYKNYIIRSKAAEAPGGVAKIKEGEMYYFSQASTLLEAGPTNIPPSPIKVLANFSADPRWQSINFNISYPIFFGYQATINSDNSVNCDALGDLDGDGDTSIYRIVVVPPSGGHGYPRAGSMQIFDELE